ncbi:hypothetical protein LCI18_014147 [Fusarium solani-melongenae]|uniref:Uncharacterized protein n=1 Tax=Fusarium solani subsp. cucurbitae TaxID=2747967 RepID=A0ACD3ZQI6_FUSSC|nr:hypothetical protein LCI18_014147 [Fusarium solani-melongenae]
MPRQPASSLASWERLPGELKLMIVGHVVESFKQVQSPKLSACAAVCREWQHLFEAETFSDLALHQSDVSEFADLVQGRRKPLLRWLWLRLELTEYDCKECPVRETIVEDRANKFILTNAVWELFDTLSDWKRKDAVTTTRQGFTFEISAHSPSDLRHAGPKMRRRANNKGQMGAMGPEQLIQHNTRVSGDGPRKCISHYRPRLFGELTGLRFDMRAQPIKRLKTLPCVRVVDTFLIRRQCLRYFSVPKTLQPIIQSLTQLKHLRYEHWGALSSGMGFTSLKSKKTLRSVACYEDMTHAKLRSLRTPRHGLARALVKPSQRLELHFAHNVDAMDFFFYIVTDNPNPDKGAKWNRLERISLTSAWLRPPGYQHLILRAVKVAQRMPKLQRMELWHTDVWGSCIFQYKADPEQPLVRLSSTWFGCLGVSGEKAWREVASTQESRHQLLIEYKLLDQRDFAQHNYMLRYLDQGDRLLNATSWNQLLDEGRPKPILKRSIPQAATSHV